MPTISLKTIYATLNELAEIGAVRLSRLGTGNLRVDADLTPHAHAVCRECGHVVDLPIDSDAVRQWVPARVEGFEFDSYDVLLQGLCNDCNRKGAKLRHHLARKD